MASEDLYELRNYLAMGNYNHVMSEAPQVKANPYSKGSKANSDKEMIVERDYIIAKAQLGLKRYKAVIQDMEGSQESSHRAVKILAEYLVADAAMDQRGKDGAVARAKSLVEEVLSAEGEATERSCWMALTCANVMAHAGDLSTAYLWLKTWMGTLQKKAEEQKAADHTEGAGGASALLLEVHAQLVDIYLRINKVEAADMELRAMDKIDDEAVQTTFWRAMVCMRRGPEQETGKGSGSTYTARGISLFNELISKHGNTVMLLNGKALCHMAERDFTQALKVLDEALSIRESDPDTMINVLACQRQVRGTENKSMLDQLISSAPHHPWVIDHNRLEQAFQDATAYV